MGRRLVSRWGVRHNIDVEKIRSAITAAEQRTSGEIRVSVASYFWGDVRRVAERAFKRLGMTATAQRNGILFFIVPARRRFTVIGDVGIHAKVGQEFWNKLAAILEAKFREGDFSGGLLAAIAAAGEGLASHFPYERSADVNELPDDIDFGARP